MFMRKWVFWQRSCISVLLACSGPPPRAAQPTLNNPNITCASDDMRRHYCRIDTQGRVRMVNQHSGSPCIQGQTWGYDNSGIWVDRGCRGGFCCRAWRRQGAAIILRRAPPTASSGWNDHLFLEQHEAKFLLGVYGSRSQAGVSAQRLCLRPGPNLGIEQPGNLGGPGCRADFQVYR